MSENAKKWFRAAGRRAVKTIAQTFVAMTGTAAVMGDVELAYGCIRLCTGRHSVHGYICSRPARAGYKNGCLRWGGPIFPAAGLSGRCDIATCDLQLFMAQGCPWALFFDGGKHYE